MTNEADALTTKIALNWPCANVVLVQDLDDEGKVVCVVLLVREDYMRSSMNLSLIHI